MTVISTLYLAMQKASKQNQNQKCKNTTKSRKPRPKIKINAVVVLLLMEFWCINCWFSLEIIVSSFKTKLRPNQSMIIRPTINIRTNLLKTKTKTKTVAYSSTESLHSLPV